jgi:enoyl-[acyl-carrier protein] reductase I
MLLKNKRALILGVANERSLAWGVAKAFKEAGASIALTYPNEMMQTKVQPLAESIGADFTCMVDVSIDQHFLDLKTMIEKKWGKFDIIVHSLAFADKDDLKGRFSDISRNGFMKAFDISAYSLIALCHHLREMLNANASVMSMTYEGSQKIIKGYNVMGVAKAALEASSRYLADDLGPDGIRVNCISSGPIRTLASSAVSGVHSLTKEIEKRSPLRRAVTIDDIGGTAVYLASDLSSGVTGQIIYVDSGVSVTVM